MEPRPVREGHGIFIQTDQQQHDHRLRTLNAWSICPGLSNGDVIDASITGNRITVTQDGVTIATASDDTFTSESPGIGLARPARYGQYVRLHKLRRERLMIYHASFRDSRSASVIVIN